MTKICQINLGLTRTAAPIPTKALGDNLLRYQEALKTDKTRAYLKLRTLPHTLNTTLCGIYIIVRSIIHRVVCDSRAFTTLHSGSAGAFHYIKIVLLTTTTLRNSLYLVSEVSGSEVLAAIAYPSSGQTDLWSLWQSSSIQNSQGEHIDTGVYVYFTCVKYHGPPSIP